VETGAEIRDGSGDTDGGGFLGLSERLGGLRRLRGRNCGHTSDNAEGVGLGEESGLRVCVD
jgi:hypothetical protein